MRLFNADGSYSEVSGQRRARPWRRPARRCPGASARRRSSSTPTPARSGWTLLRRDGTRLTFRAAMGQPEAIARADARRGRRAAAGGHAARGQPAVRGGSNASLSDERMHRLGALLEHHDAFPEGTNVEFATVESPVASADPDLGARRRPDARLRHGSLRVCRRRRGVRRRRPRPGGGGARRHAASRVARRRGCSSRAGPRCCAGAPGSPERSQPLRTPRVNSRLFLHTRQAGGHRRRRGFGGAGGSGCAAITSSSRARTPSSVRLAAG